MSLAEQYAHLVEVAREYRELVQLTERGALEAEEQRTLLSQRSVVHDQLIVLFEQLEIPFVDRNDVRRQAMNIAARGRVLLTENTTEVIRGHLGAPSEEI